jgi:hypothetical protein
MHRKCPYSRRGRVKPGVDHTNGMLRPRITARKGEYIARVVQFLCQA